MCFKWAQCIVMEMEVWGWGRGGAGQIGGGADRVGLRRGGAEEGRGR